MNFTCSHVDASTVSAEDTILLYQAAGFGKKGDYQPSAVRRALDNSALVVAARDATGRLVGLARVLSDGELTSYVADIAVHPSFQRQGIGTQIMDIIVREYGHTIIYSDSLMSLSRFFQGSGFPKRPMSVFARKPNSSRIPLLTTDLRSA